MRLPFEELAGQTVELRDALGDAVYERNGDDLLAGGLYLDLPGWGHHAFVSTLDWASRTLVLRGRCEA